MRYISSLPILFFFISTYSGYSQSRSQLRFKIGVAKSIVIPDETRNYVYRIGSPHQKAGVIALEYSQYTKNKSTSWHAGISLDPVQASFSLETANFQFYDNNPVLTIGESIFRFYGGLGKRISKPGEKNSFSFFGGMGLAVYFNEQGGWMSIPYGSEGVTINSEMFKSYFDNSALHPGYTTRVYFSRDFHITPTVHTGFRWQRSNRKGNEGLGLELLANYGLSKYFEYDVPYTIDGMGYKDSFNDKEISVQLNLIIPVKNFGRKKLKR